MRNAVMYRKVGFLVALGFTLSPFAASGATVEEIQAQIKALLLQIEILQNEIRNGTLPSTSTPYVPSIPPNIPPVSSSSCVNITRNLLPGMRGGDVAQLQAFLSLDPSIYPDGTVSGYFGQLTQIAVQRFQAKQGIAQSGSPDSNGFGAVGPRTRSLIRSLSCGPVTVPPIYLPVNPNLPTAQAPCIAGGISIPSGSSATLYSTASVPQGSECGQYAQVRQCINGSLSGSPTFQYSSCAVTGPQHCRVGDTTVLHGSSQVFYSRSSVEYGSSCSNFAQTRACVGGALSGSSQYLYPSCTTNAANSCTQDSATVAHNSSRTFYSAALMPFGGSCATVAQSRTCTNGTLSGGSAYSFATCNVASSTSCFMSGVTLSSNTGTTFYSAATVPYGSTCASIGSYRQCVNGVLDGSTAHTHAVCSVVAASSCTLDGVQVAHGTQRIFYSSNVAPVGGFCSSISASRLCSNGSFPSDTSAYNKASCSLASCTLDGQTVPSGTARDFYLASTVPFNSSCTKISRLCTNGLFPSATDAYRYASCSVGAQPAPTCTLTATPSTILPNQPTTLSWTTQNATGGTLFGSSISPVSSGSRLFAGYSSTGDRTVTLDVTGNGAGQCSTVVKVQSVLPPTCTLIAKKNVSTLVYQSPVSVTYDDTLILEWTSVGAQEYSVTIPSGVEIASSTTGVAFGSTSFKPTESLYRYTFKNAGGTAQCVMAVNYAPPTCTLETVPYYKSSYVYGDPVTLTWTSTNADYVTATSSSRLTTSGTVTFPNVKSSTTYVFTAYGRGGQQTCAKAITVSTPLSVLQPTGGTYGRGTDMPISWQYSGTPPFGSAVYLSLINANGDTVGTNLIATGLSASSAYVWNIPQTLGATTLTSGDYRIRAVLYSDTSKCTTSGCSGETVHARADSGLFTLSIPPVAQGNSQQSIAGDTNTTQLAAALAAYQELVNILSAFLKTAGL